MAQLAANGGNFNTSVDGDIELELTIIAKTGTEPKVFGVSFGADNMTDSKVTIETPDGGKKVYEVIMRSTHYNCTPTCAMILNNENLKYLEDKHTVKLGYL